MNKKNLKGISILLIIVLLSITFVGCAGNKVELANTTATTTQSIVETTEATNTPIYPLKTDVVLTIVGGAGNGQGAYASPYDTPYYKELTKLTGVKVKYIECPTKESFSILLASGDYPDIMENNWFGYTAGSMGYNSGPDQAINDKIIIKLNEVIDKYAPNLKKYLADNPVADKQVKSDSGAYYVFPCLREKGSIPTYFGLMMRKDWLEDTGLTAPTTIDEWYTVLKAFKEKKNATAPLSIFLPDFAQYGAFIGAFGTTGDFYIDNNGKIKYGFIEPGYKDYLILMKKWYDEGLLDKNNATLSWDILQANILNGITGATYGYLGGSLGAYNSLLKEKDPRAVLIGVDYPTLNKGEKHEFGFLNDPYSYTGGNAAISSKCKNVEIAARFLDFGYSEKGLLLNNFGIEGETYKMIDGNPVFTDLIMHPQAGVTMTALLEGYARAQGNGPLVITKKFSDQYFGSVEQKQALTCWTNTNADKHLLPPLTYSKEESAEMANGTWGTDIYVYVSEMLYKFIMGREPIENFDSYVEKVKSMGIDKSIEARQSALDRYNNR